MYYPIFIFGNCSKPWLLILGYGIGTAIGCLIICIIEGAPKIKDKIRERKERKEAKKRWQARLEKFRANGGWLPMDE